MNLNINRGEQLAAMSPKQREAFESVWGDLEAELCDELKEHLCNSEFVGTCVKHPLVFAIPYHDLMADQLNHALAGKKEACERALAERDWERYMWLHERPYRHDAVMGVLLWHDPTPEEWWSLVRSLWTDTENLWQWSDQIEEILADDGHRELMMDEDERALLDAMPATVKVWRGYAGDNDNAHGWSWTVDYDKARWFARRLTHRGEGRVAHGKVARESVVALLMCRGESEVIVDPDDVRMFRTEKIREEKP